jgi:DNA-binding NarL/FixJ family response regulator
MFRKSDECFGCIKERSAQRAERIIELWAEGKKVREIAADLGTTHGSVQQEIHRLRAKGCDLPYRRAVD